MICLGGLGDLLVALPSMAFLRRTLPGQRLVLLCRGEYGGLFLDPGIADEIVPLEGREASFLFGGGRCPAAGPGRGLLAGDRLDADSASTPGWKPLSGAWESPRSLSQRRSAVAGTAQPELFRGYPGRLPRPGRRSSRFRRMLAAPFGEGGDGGGAGPARERDSRRRGLRGHSSGKRGNAKVWPFERFFEIARSPRERRDPRALPDRGRGRSAPRSPGDSNGNPCRRAGDGSAGRRSLRSRGCWPASLYISATIRESLIWPRRAGRA